MKRLCGISTPLAVLPTGGGSGAAPRLGAGTMSPQGKAP